MNSTGGAPPPPPPPFKFPGMVIPQPRPPPSVVSEAPQPPTMASIQKAGMPAALAGAMMKDKKPFTYTPGGLDLSEIKSSRMQRRLQRNASLEGVKPAPVSQQTSPPIKCPSPMPPQGMIQVLPMPGVGMAPTAKSQAKEPIPKAKRTVCGPAPLPPPFACGAEGHPQPTEAEKKTPVKNSNNITAHNAEPQNNVSPPKPPPVLSTNGLCSDGLTEQSPVEDNNIPTSDIPPPPPLPSTNKSKGGHEAQIHNLNDFVDTTELDDTINSFSNKADKKENTQIQLMQDVPKENVDHINDINEHAIDSVSEFTDCSSPFYPDEPNSLINPSDQSQEIASSSDADHIALEILPETPKHDSNRWTSDKCINLDTRNDSKIDKSNNSLVNNSNGVVKIGQDYQEDDLQKKKHEQQENSIDIMIENPVDIHQENDAGTRTESIAVFQDQQETNNDMRIGNIAVAHDHQGTETNNDKRIGNIVVAHDHQGTNNEMRIGNIGVAHDHQGTNNGMRIGNIGVAHDHQETNNDKIIRNSAVGHNNQGSNNDMRMGKIAVAHDDQGTNNDKIIGNSAVDHNNQGTNNDMRMGNIAVAHDHQGTNRDMRIGNIAVAHDHQENNNDMRIVRPAVVSNSFNASPEVASEHLPVYGERVVERLYSKEGNTHNVQPPSRTNDAPCRMENISRQSSLPANSMAGLLQGNNATNGNTRVNTNSAGFTPQQYSQEKHSLDMDKPLPWMVGIKREEPTSPDFVQRPGKASQQLHRQNSLPQNKDAKYQSAPWRQPHHRSAGPAVRNRSVSPDSMHLSSNGGRMPTQNQPSTNDGRRAVSSQNQYATLPSRYRSKDQEVHFQNNITQYNSAIDQSQPKERIIPITLETSPPDTPQGNIEAFQLNCRPNMAAPYNNQNNYNLNSHTDYPYPSGPNSSANNFSTCNPTTVPYSINATEALQQIQSNLNKLNNGLRNEEPYSQNRPQENEGVKVVVTNDVPAIQSKSFNTIQMAYGSPASADSTAEEPRKYAGSNIPSRSFKVIQAMTNSQASDDWNPGRSNESKRSDESAQPFKPHSNVNWFARKDQDHIPPKYPPSTSSSVSTYSSPSSFESDSFAAPSSHNVRGSPLYQAVSPHRIPPPPPPPPPPFESKGVGSLVRLKTPHSTLSSENIDNKRPSSAMSQSSLGSDSAAYSTYGFNSSESPSRLLSIIQQESEKHKDKGSSDNLYSNDKIPLRSATDWQNGNNASQYDSSLSSVNNELTDVIRSNFKVQDKYSPTPSWSSATDHEEGHQEGLIKTAAAKQSVLKELTSHFDPKTALRKPKAAPGRVFKHLQEQYDSPLHQQNTSLSHNDNSDEYITQPKFNNDSRIPGNTFRMLQENIESHPSVLQARK